jgi:hypothetical protein
MTSSEIEGNVVPIFFGEANVSTFQKHTKYALVMQNVQKALFVLGYAISYNVLVSLPPLVLPY